MTELHDLGVVALAAAVRRREVSAVEVAEHFLRRAEHDDVGAFTVLAPELALAEAGRTDRRLADDPATAGPLAGVPCPVKDLTRVAGVPMRAGSAAIPSLRPDVDDGVVQLLRRAGTTMLAKTSTPEFGLPCYTEPETGPPAVTPWDRTRSAGGSSGGAAAAVAARLAPVAHGNDGGGSIRLPAACCGLVGFKPTRGLVSMGPHAQPGPGLASHGVLTRDVADTALLLDVLARPWPGDWPVPRPDSFPDVAARPPRRLRVGVLTEPLIHAQASPHPAASRAVTRTADALAAAGHEVTGLTAPFPPEAWDGFADVWAVGALAAPVGPGAEERLRPLTRWLRDRGRRVGGLELAGALQAMQALTQQVDRAWDHVDVVLTPTMAAPPWPVGALRDDDDPAGDFAAQTAQTPWCSVWNITGAPSLSLPLHAEEVDDGAGGRVRLPFGVLLGGRPGADAELLALGAELEGLLGTPVPAPDPGVDR